MSRFICSGRTFPNGPAHSRVGCTRRSPRVLQVRFEQANIPEWNEYAGMWVNLFFTGNPLPGLDPTCNWNLQEDPGHGGLDINLNVQRTFLGPPYRVQVDYKHGAFPVIHQVYETDPADWIDWELFLSPQTLNIVSVSTPGPLILTNWIEVRIGTYDLIPANTCL